MPGQAGPRETFACAATPAIAADDPHAHGRARLEQNRAAIAAALRGIVRGSVVELVKRRQVVQDPERAPMGRDDHLDVLDDQVVDRRDRQVAAEPMPASAVVERNVDARLGPAIEQALAARVLADRPRELAVGDAAGDLAPRLAAVGGLVQIGPRVVVLVTRGRDVKRVLVVRRGFDDADQRPFRQCVGRPPVTFACVPSGVMLVQVRPPSSERWTSPSSVPHQRRSRRCGDSASAKIVQ